METKKEPGSGLRPLKRRRLSAEISNQLKGLIFNGEYKPGDKLPSENELCQIFEVGRPVVREALRNLENSGLIYVRPGAGGGPFVKKIGTDNLLEMLEGILKLEAVSVEALTEARLTIELAILPLVLERIQPEDLDELRENIKEAEEALKGGDREPRNLKFHIILANASQNELLMKFTGALLGLMAKVLQTYRYSAERKKKILEDHKHILALLEKKKHEELSDFLAEHIRGGLSYI
jgi:GntR family transcriptional regulator, transcriptional repressor for pyruvate dehydrogenase complex